MGHTITENRFTLPNSLQLPVAPQQGWGGGLISPSSIQQPLTASSSWVGIGLSQEFLLYPTTSNCQWLLSGGGGGWVPPLSMKECWLALTYTVLVKAVMDSVDSYMHSLLCPEGTVFHQLSQTSVFCNLYTFSSSVVLSEPSVWTCDMNVFSTEHSIDYSFLVWESTY